MRGLQPICVVIKATNYFQKDDYYPSSLVIEILSRN